MDREKLGLMIREKRKEKGMTQKELAQQLHITDKAVSKWETGISFPDITLMEKLADALDVSIYELMANEVMTEEAGKADEVCYEQEDESSIQKKQADEVFREILREFMDKLKRQQRKHILIVGGLVGFFFLLLLLIKNSINMGIGYWGDLNKNVYHQSDITVITGMNDEIEGYFLYVEPGDDNNYYNYRVGAVDENRKERILFTLQEHGMKLDRTPKLVETKQYLYILFDGLDNEDPGERVYNGKIYCDPQGFLPHLYRYEIVTGEVRNIPLKEENKSMLLDVFSYGGETCYIRQQFEGLLFGLDLGFYKGAESYIGNLGIKGENLTGEGGLQVKGCLTDQCYFIPGQNGIYQYNLEKKQESLIKEMDLSLFTRAELKCLKLGDRDCFVLIGARMKETDQFDTVKACETVVTVYEKDWETVAETILPHGISALEWGKTDAMITEVENRQVYSTCIDFESMETEGYADRMTEQQRLTMVRQKDERADSLEEGRMQWVYLKKRNEYYLTGE